MHGNCQRGAGRAIAPPAPVILLFGRRFDHEPTLKRATPLGQLEKTTRADFVLARPSHRDVVAKTKGQSGC